MNEPSLEDRIQRVIRQDVQSMHGYAIQQSAGLVKLDAMENPFQLPQPLRRELGERLAEVAVNRYPGNRIDDLRRALASYIDMPEGCDLLLGNGSDEIITMLSMACDVPDACVLAPLPGFVMYAMSARLQGMKFVGVPLTADFELDEAAMLDAIRTHRPGLIYIAYPNNPTANLFDDAVIERIIDAAPGLVVMDEAYQPFSSRTWLNRLGTGRQPHVLVMRTLSKFGLAGARLGYMVGDKALIAQINKVRPPYNVSVLNAEVGLFALEHANEFAEQAAVLRHERTQLLAALATTAGVIRAYPSEANMILVRVGDARAAFEGMKKRGVLVKNVSALHPALENCLRLTVGTPDENLLMMAALTASLSDVAPR